MIYLNQNIRKTIKKSLNEETFKNIEFSNEEKRNIISLIEKKQRNQKKYSFILISLTSICVLIVFMIFVKGEYEDYSNLNQAQLKVQKYNAKYNLEIQDRKQYNESLSNIYEEIYSFFDSLQQDSPNLTNKLKGFKTFDNQTIIYIKDEVEKKFVLPFNPSTKIEFIVLGDYKIISENKLDITIQVKLTNQSKNLKFSFVKENDDWVIWDLNS